MFYYYNYWHYISTLLPLYLYKHEYFSNIILPLYRSHLQQEHYYPYDCRDDGCV